MIDLHTHSTASDGAFSPTELIQKAHQIGLTAIALTDHDVVSGIPEFQQAARQYPHLTPISGSELGAHHPEDEIEIIAMDIPDKALPAFMERQKKLLQIRQQANLERLVKLNALGFDLTLDELSVDQNGQKRTQIGKPHIATALWKKGYVSDTQEAFQKYLNRGGPAYVKKKDPDFIETISFIRDNGAVPVLAHPVFVHPKNLSLADLIHDLKKNGLMGMEIFHSMHTIENRREYLALARQFGLMVSGGSDFHGGPDRTAQLGIVRHNLAIPDFILDPILSRQFPTDEFYQSIETILRKENLCDR